MPIPSNIQDTLTNYIEHRRPPGDCVRAILENNMIGAYSRADEDTAAAMREIVMFLCNDAPARCWGSPEKVDDWLQGDPEISEQIDRAEHEHKYRGTMCDSACGFCGGCS